MDHQKDKAEKEKNRWKKHSQPIDSSKVMIEAELWSNYTCWCCNEKGLQLAHVFQRRLVAMEKLELLGSP